MPGRGRGRDWHFNRCVGRGTLIHPPFVASFVSSLLEFTGGIGTVLNDEDLGKNSSRLESRVLTKKVYIYIYIYDVYIRVFVTRRGVGEMKFADDFRESRLNIHSFVRGY